jgi:hypothetical protein
LTLVQDLAEICYKKLQIGIFSAVDVRKWWENLENSIILPIFAASEELFWLRR